MQLVELHFPDAPQPDFQQIRARAAEVLDLPVKASELSDRGSTGCLLAHTRYRVMSEEGAVPACTVIASSHHPIRLDAYKGEIQQSWRFRESASALRSSRHSLLVSELMTEALPAKERCRLFHAVLQALVEHTNPNALVFRHSQQVIDPADYLESAAGNGYADPMRRPGSLNIRVFRVEGRGLKHRQTKGDLIGDLVMDTRGLDEVGLRDFQCHFHLLEPKQISKVLMNAALHLYDHGPVIRTGNTIAGVGDAPWLCSVEKALVGPARPVIDIDPGPPFAARQRSH